MSTRWTRETEFCRREGLHPNPEDVQRDRRCERGEERGEEELHPGIGRSSFGGYVEAFGFGPVPAYPAEVAYQVEGVLGYLA